MTTDPSASVRLAAVLDRSAGQQNSGLFILSHLRTPSASLRGYATPLFDEIWFCRWACYGVYTWAIVAATVDAAVGAIVIPTGRGHTITRCAKTHGNRAAGGEFDDISEANIRLWRRQKIRLEALPRSKLAQRGQASAYPELERQLVE